MNQVHEILTHLNIVHNSLKQLSDMPDEPMALIPYPIIQGLIAEGENTDGNTTLLESLKKNKQRLENKAYMYYWKGVMSFSPKHTHCILSSRHIRVEERPIITVEVAKHLFQSDQPLFHITEEEWCSYTCCKNFHLKPLLHTSVWKWWEDVGTVQFPIFCAAQHYLWVPPIVTACDSLLSIMGWKYNPRQASLDSDVIATQMFIRGNLNKLDYVGPSRVETVPDLDGSPSDTDTSESELSI